MSRAYRISASESIRRHIRVEDGFKTGLDVLDVLPRESMSGLLCAELEGRGFAKDEDGRMVRVEDDGTAVTVDPSDFTVTVRRAAEEDFERRRSGTAASYKLKDGEVTERLRRRLQAALEQDAEARREDLQAEATDALQRRLLDLRPELDAVAHTVVATALKKKAASLGEIREIHEDAEAGTLTIRIEV